MFDDNYDTTNTAHVIIINRYNENEIPFLMMTHLIQLLLSHMFHVNKNIQLI